MRKDTLDVLVKFYNLNPECIQSTYGETAELEFFGPHQGPNHQALLLIVSDGWMPETVFGDKMPHLSLTGRYWRMPGYINIYDIDTTWPTRAEDFDLKSSLAKKMIEDNFRCENSITYIIDAAGKRQIVDGKRRISIARELFRRNLYGNYRLPMRILLSATRVI
jgi:hypothetical protein